MNWRSRNAVASFCRSELVAQAMGAKSSWFSSVAEVVRLRRVAEAERSRWGVYRGGLRRIQELLGDVGCVLPPAGPLPAFHPSGSTDHYQVRSNGFVH